MSKSSSLALHVSVVEDVDAKDVTSRARATGALVAGAVIAGLVVKERIGRGGMGEVWLAYDPVLEVERAIKIISGKKAQSAALSQSEVKELRARFLREARTLARLRHPHIVPIHSMGEHSGEPYFVMSYVPSLDARRWLVAERPSLEEVRLVALQVADALAYAHSQGVLHRDLKLSNVLVAPAEVQGDVPCPSDDGVFASARVERAMPAGANRAARRYDATLIDFGLAKGSTDTALTRTGRSMGTFSYFAPEYVMACMRGQRPAHTVATDLWALGCVLYALTCQQPAFSDDDDLKLLAKIQCAEFVPVDVLKPEVPGDWVELVHELLEVDPKLRLSQAAEVARRIRGMCFYGHESEEAPVLAATADDDAAEVWVDDEPAAEPLAHAEDPDIAAEIEPLLRAAPAPPRAASTSKPNITPFRKLKKQRDAAGAELEVAAPAPSPAAGVSLPESLQPAAVPAPAAALVLAQAHGAQAAAEPAERTTSSSASSLNAPFFVPEAAAQATRRPVPTALLLPVCAALAVLFVGGAVVYASSAARGTDAALALPDRDEGARRQRAFFELKALEEERARQVQPRVPGTKVFEGLVPSALPSPPPGAVPVPVLPGASPLTLDDGPVVDAQMPARAVPPARDDPWAARYGTRASFNTSAMGGSGVVGVAAVAAGPASRTAVAGGAGVRVPVRVKDAIASAPMGPVIAVVTAATKVGDVVLPVGTEVHGATAGTSGARVLVSFSFAVIDGAKIPLRGVAVGLDGRVGVHGTRSLGGVSDVAAGGAAGAVGGAVDAVVGVVDDSVLGGALRGAGGPASSKMGRINNEEEIVVTPRGARFVVYVEDVR